MGSIPITRSILALIGAMMSIQAGAAIAKSLFAVLTAQGVTALRLAFGSLLLVVVLRPWRDVAWLRQPRALRMLLSYGATLGMMNLLFYVALRGLPLGVCVAIEFLGPLSVAVWNSRRSADFVWIAFAVLGLALLLPWSSSSRPMPLISLVAALGTGVSWAMYIVFGQRLGRMAPANGPSIVALGMVVATVVAAPAGILSAGSALLDPRWLPAALAVAVLSSAIPYPLDMAAMQRLPARTFGILMSVEPAMAALAGVVLLQERLQGVQWFAIGSIVIASVGSAASARREAP